MSRDAPVRAPEAGRANDRAPDSNTTFYGGHERETDANRWRLDLMPSALDQNASDEERRQELPGRVPPRRTRVEDHLRRVVQDSQAREHLPRLGRRRARRPAGSRPRTTRHGDARTDGSRGRRPLACQPGRRRGVNAGLPPHVPEPGAHRDRRPPRRHASPSSTSSISSPHSTTEGRREGRSARRCSRSRWCSTTSGSTRTLPATGRCGSRARSVPSLSRRPPTMSRPSTGRCRRSIGCRCCSSTGRAPASPRST